MITVIDQQASTGYLKAFYAGLSTDDKPVGCVGNSRFLETDTGDIYVYDGASWFPMSKNTQGGLVERLMANVLKRLNVDANGRLRVSAEYVANMTTLTTVTNLTNIGPLAAVAREQAEAHCRFQSGYRRNLVVS